MFVFYTLVVWLSADLCFVTTDLDCCKLALLVLDFPLSSRRTKVLDSPLPLPFSLLLTRFTFLIDRSIILFEQEVCVSVIDAFS